MLAIWMVSWTEYERGWGCRPDGYTYYATRESCDADLECFAALQPKDHVPDEYSLPGDPLIVECDQTLYDQVQAKGVVFSMKPLHKRQ